MKKISKSDPVPLHYQLKTILLDMIENEELKPGDMIPTERELCDIQGVSRMTINKAIMSLVNEGVLYREQGKGTFVAKPKEKQEIYKLKSFTEEMSEKGLATSTRIISFEIKEATKKNKSILKIPKEFNKVIEIRRLRMTEKDPVAIETVWIPEHLFKGMTTDMIEGKSLYAIFKQKFNYHPKKARQTIEPVTLSEFEAKLLDQKENALALMFKRITYAENDVPIEYTNTINRSDKYEYEILLT